MYLQLEGPVSILLNYTQKPQIDFWEQSLAYTNSWNVATN